MSVGDDEIVRVVDDAGSAAVAGEVSVELARVLARAARVNHLVEKRPDLSFSSTLIALVGGADDTSHWLRTYLSSTDVDIPELLRTRSIADEAELETILEPAVEPIELAEPLVASRSAVRLLSVARRLCEEASNGAALDVRHLIGAYIYDGADHEADFDHLQFNRPDWSVAFVTFVGRWRPNEATTWSDQHRRKFPKTPLGVVDNVGPSTHITSDLWTTTDSLGYSAYAFAIAKFIRHERTVAPLAIGMQAPWGAGKTSLMRMIEHELEREGTRSNGGDGQTPELDASNRADRPMTTRDVRDLAAKESRQRSSSPLEGIEVRPLTVWFNAWKYESTNQVWAGLADAILHQVAARLPVRERETFWLRLNFSRIGPDRVRQRIHGWIFGACWRASRWILIAAGWLVATLALAALTGGALHNESTRHVGIIGATISALCGGLGVAATWLTTRSKLLGTKAGSALPDLLAVPPYEQELGFVHQVEEDVRRVLQALEAARPGSPLVIFVDDLDRCSPTKVAQVVEAVNLFLAGSMPRCIFVVGLDAEMVAAALQAAHADLIKHLPAEAGTPVGWRFMDKFIQLPFMIPPIAPRDRNRYVEALFDDELHGGRDRALDSPEVLIALGHIRDRTDVGREVAQLQRTLRLDPAEEARLRRALEGQADRVDIEDGVSRFSDAGDDIRQLVKGAATHFSSNPRELKRFVNTFRFQYFLAWAGKARTGRTVSLGQLQRWVILSLRWPEVVRWNWRGHAESSRLELLELVAGECDDFDVWIRAAPSRLRLDPTTTDWLHDSSLYAFLREETQLPVEERLTAGIGRGLW